MNNHDQSHRKPDFPDLTQEGIRSFRSKIYEHYREHPRPLPWRDTHNPYHILVSEIMLQQTQVERVLEKYLAFLDRFPDIFSLARASLREVLALWQGLGYNRRAAALRETAKIVCSDYNGLIPETPEQLKRLPGIGIYTAAAVATFAFHLPLPFIETNIRAVFIHCFFKDKKDVRDRDIMPLVEATLDTENPRQWYYALMDYGVALKRNVVNPSRKSAHHSRQSPFKGSDRQIRGNILKLLLRTPRSRKNDIIRTLEEEPQRIERILHDLEREGFIMEKDDHYIISD